MRLDWLLLNPCPACGTPRYRNYNIEMVFLRPGMIFWQGSKITHYIKEEHEGKYLVEKVNEHWHCHVCNAIGSILKHLTYFHYKKFDDYDFEDIYHMTGSTGADG